MRAKRKAAYQKFIGTSWTNIANYPNSTSDNDTGIKYISFKEDSISITTSSTTQQISFNPETDALQAEDLPDDEPLKTSYKYLEYEKFTLQFNERYYFIYSFGGPEDLDILKVCIYKGADGYFDLFDPVSDTDSGTAPAEFAGTYSYTAASGTAQKSGSLTFAEDGTYTYSGSATSVAAANGTWSMSGDKLTVKFTASGQDVEAVFTVSENGNSVTFTADTNSGYITFLSSYFGVMSETITFTKSE